MSPWLDFNLDDWVTHSDPSVNAAVMSMSTLDIFDMGFIRPEMALTQRIIDEEGIGPGEEVFMTGLFVNRRGTVRNGPIVRVGNSAAMRGKEKVFSPRIGDMDAYLIEARSIAV